MSVPVSKERCQKRIVAVNRYAYALIAIIMKLPAAF